MLNLSDKHNGAIVRTRGTGNAYLTTIEKAVDQFITWSSPTSSKEAAQIKHDETLELVKQGTLGAFDTVVQ